ncbi:MAG: hypothetical protein GC164_02500 [Phycisphaera sp.]|nr:hypothetical protein [Phycisphaera sp.]
MPTRRPYRRLSAGPRRSHDTTIHTASGSMNGYPGVEPLEPRLFLSAAEFAWSTYIGGTSYDGGGAVATDTNGNVYVSGRTSSTESWVTGGGDTSFNGDEDAFVAKFSSDGVLQWSTFLGGTTYDNSVTGLAVDTSGNVYVSGYTESSGWVSGGYDSSYNGNGDAFAAKLNSSGSLMWSTYLGGSEADGAYDLALDSSNNVYVVGYTDSSGWVSGGADTTYGGNRDGFVFKLNSNGGFLKSTYFGGDGVDLAYGVAVDSSDNVVVVGSTASALLVSGGWDSVYDGFQDGFVVQYNALGVHQWSTYLGSTGQDEALGVAIDAWDNIFVAGHTSADTWVSGGYDTSINGNEDGFVTKFDSMGSHLWSTYLGGSSDDRATGVAVDTTGNAYITGFTLSNSWLSNGPDLSLGGDKDVFVLKLSSDSVPLWGTYVGGDSDEESYGIAVDTWGAVLVGGDTFSSGWVSGQNDNTFSGDLDALLVKLMPNAQTLHDFNNDGYDDIIFRNQSTGLNTAWYMQGSMKLSSPALPTVADADWQIAGIADMNGDGQPDLVWRHATNGGNIVWTMNGSTKTGSVGLPTVAENNWKIAGVADLNGDGKNDLVWRNMSSGLNIVWTMNGTAKSGSVGLPTVADTNWMIVGVGDLNRDSQNDLLWRHATTGNNILWTMNGSTKTGSVGLPAVVDTSWSIVGLFHHDNDGDLDILWRNDTLNALLVWTMDGTSKTGSVGLPSVASVWKPSL